MRWVLAVDDEPGVLRLIGSVLETAGFGVLSARGREGALKILENHQVDVLLTELSMATLSGAELIREVRKRHPLVGICCMAGYLAEFDAAIGDLPILAKPFAVEDLIQMVEQAAQRASARTAAAAHGQAIPGR